jgi:small conductance mechanosensitive channel
VVDVPIGFAAVDRAVEVLREAADGIAHDPEFAEALIDPPDVLGVEQITVEGAVLRTTVKTASDAQWRVGRELRRRLTDALAAAGIAAQLPNSRVYLRPGVTTAAAPVDALNSDPHGAEPAGAETGQGGPT